MTPAGFERIDPTENWNASRSLLFTLAIPRDHTGVRAVFAPNSHVAIVARLPKTRSGKVLRGTMRAIADSQQHTVPPTIDDASTLEEIATALRTLGYAARAHPHRGA